MNISEKKFINECLKFFGISALVVVIWQLVELIIVGKINPNNVDTVIGFILSCSLYFNLRAWNNKN